MLLGEPIGRGRSAEIYALPKNRVLKLYLIDVGEETIRHERRAQRWAQKLGLPVPKTGLARRVGERLGFAMERIEGINGMEFIMQNLNRFDEEAWRLAELQVRVNSCNGGSLRDRRDFLAKRIERCARLGGEEKAKLRVILERLPRGDRLLHGDFHPGNLMRAPDGPVIIDWIDAARGVPEADVARSLVLFGAPLAGIRSAEDPRESFTKLYIERYIAAYGKPLMNLSEWHLVTAAARLDEGAAADDVDLAMQVKTVLSRL